MTGPVLSTAAWRTNAELIAHAVVPLGYLRKEWVTLDPTYGKGKFYTLWKPDQLLRGDLEPSKSPDFPGGLDARRTGLLNDSVDVTVLDGPYRCVSLDTEILTTEGWKSWANCSVGDMAYTLNHETGQGEWCRVDAHHVLTGSQVMMEMGGKSFSALTTHDHRWPVVSSKGVRAWKTSETLSKGDRVVRSAPSASIPEYHLWEDAFVELVAWFWTEGHVKGVKTATGGTGGYGHICQSRLANPKNCDSIEAAFRDMYGDPTPEFPRNGRNEPGRWWRMRDDGPNIRFIFSASIGRDLLSAAPLKVPSHDFLLSLDRDQLNLFIRTSLAADGTPNGSGKLTQKYQSMAEAFQFACTIAGISTSIKKGGGNMWEVQLRGATMSKPVRNQPTTFASDEPVWCVTTANGSWLARRHGTVYFTGNCNGTPDMPFDESYGVDQKVPWQDRIQIIKDMMTEANRISRHNVLVKCQAQVVSGKVRWQDRIFADHGESLGMTLVDRFDMVPNHRPQPTHNSDGTERRQVHARRNNSTLLVFKA